jgi:nucleoside-diphosphate-sugar epimerase
MSERNVEASVLIAGAQGMVGSAIVRRLQALGYQRLLTPTRQELDLIDQIAVAGYFAQHAIDQVYVAAACAHVMELPLNDYAAVTTQRCSHLNVGTGEDCSIGTLATLIAEVVGYQGSIRFDSSKPDGTPRKLLDVSRMQRLGWHPTIGLREGLAATYAWYVAQAEVRA